MAEYRYASEGMGGDPALRTRLRVGYHHTLLGMSKSGVMRYRLLELFEPYLECPSAISGTHEGFG